MSNFKTCCLLFNNTFTNSYRHSCAVSHQVLERGPPAYNQVVLGMLCSVMRLADFSSPSMRHFQNDALKTIAKYLKVNIFDGGKRLKRQMNSNNVLSPFYYDVKSAIP